MAATEAPAHPFRDETGRFPVDALLRRCGFHIYARPERAEPVWESGGALYGEAEARDFLYDGEVASAQAAETAYYERADAKPVAPQRGQRSRLAVERN